jgi:hypothetical protein
MEWSDPDPLTRDLYAEKRFNKRNLCAQVQFLKKSLDILCECRRTLMYTYVFAYYLKKNNQSAIFEVGISDVIF